MTDNKENLYEVVYEVKATCVAHIHALTAEDAKTMVRTHEGGDVVEDTVGCERTIVAVTRVSTNLT